MSNDNNKKNDPTTEVLLSAFGGAVLGLIVGLIASAADDASDVTGSKYGILTKIVALAGCLGPIGTAIFGAIIAVCVTLNKKK